VGPDRDAEPVRTFRLLHRGSPPVRSVVERVRSPDGVMQSTGVYWIPVYDVLEQHGLDVWLVNAQDTRNLPGRKSDVQESQWLLKLHTYGLLEEIVSAGSQHPSATDLAGESGPSMYNRLAPAFSGYKKR